MHNLQPLCEYSPLFKSNHLYLYSTLYNTDCQISFTVSNRKIIAKVIIQFSSLPIVSVQSVKCPQLSKPEATAARNQNPIGDRNGEKTLGETRLSRGDSSPLARPNRQFNSNCSRVRLCRGLIWFLWSCPDGCLGDRVFTGDLSLGLI